MLAQRILGKLPANFSAKFDGENVSAHVSALFSFPGFQAPEKIHAQNSRPELLAFLSTFTFSNPMFFFHADFLLTGRSKNEISEKCKALTAIRTAFV